VVRLNWRRGLALSLSLSILAALALVLTTFEPETIQNLGLLEPRFLVLALLMFLAAISVEGRRISLVANAMGAETSWFQGCQYYLTISFAQLVTPMGMGELPALTYLYNRAGLRLGGALAAAIVRSFITKLVFLCGVLWLWFFSGGTVQFGPVTGELFNGVALVFTLTTVFNAVYVLFPRLIEGLFARIPLKWRRGALGRWQQRLAVEAREFDKGLGIMWRRGPFLLVRIALLSMLYWAIWFGLLPIIARGLNTVVAPMELISRQFALTLALPYIPVPGASGALELAMAGVYKGVVPRAVLGLFILCWRVLTYYLLLLLGGLAALGSVWSKFKIGQE